MVRPLGFTSALLSAVVGSLLAAPTAVAHCDTVGGPVAAAARRALALGKATPVLPWVSKQQEAEVLSTFRQALAARRQGAAAREVADRYFLETVVRLHRASEGEPYTGLKTTDPHADPVVAAADEALETGSADALIKKLTAEVERGLRQRFAAAKQAKAKADSSVAAGRHYVHTYVELMHYAEGIARAASGAAAQHAHPGDERSEARAHAASAPPAAARGSAQGRAASRTAAPSRARQAEAHQGHR